MKRDRKGKSKKQTKRLPNPGQVIPMVKGSAEKLCEAEGMELVHVEAVSQDSFTLRIYIDKPGGVTIEDCINISRQLGDILDIDLKFEEEYRLEVSSPGIDRPLVKQEDFVRFAGKQAKIKTQIPLDGRRKFKGLLKGMAEGCVTIEIDGKDYAIPFEQIDKARLFTDNGETGC